MIKKVIRNMTGQQRQDKIQLFHNALIQHGVLSNRIYLMKLKNACPESLIPAMDELAQSNGYTKIFAKIPASKADLFFDSNYQKEAQIPGFYQGQETALFLAHYLDSDRQKENNLHDIENILDLAKNKEKKQPSPDTLPKKACLRACVTDDAKKISDLYRKVFPSYPFPIEQPDYITETMLSHVVYFGIEIDKELVALSSAEMNDASKNVEMTDFATLPEYRGNNFGGLLLTKMEKEMASRGMLTSYTIARAISPGINITFAKAGYKYCGRLVNNTHISGQIESMNVWYKSLQR